MSNSEAFLSGVWLFPVTPICRYQCVIFSLICRRKHHFPRFLTWHLFLYSRNMSKKEQKPDRAARQGFPGYPHYPESQDVFNQKQVDGELDPEDPKKIKKTEPGGEMNAKDFGDDVSGADLDVPGAEDDDAQEEIGSEDEENNHYSLGGDNHDNLEEQDGEKL